MNSKKFILLALPFMAIHFLEISSLETSINNKAINVWNTKAEEWANHVAQLEKKDFNRFYQSDPILWKMLKDVNHLTVLDVGCGEGYISRQLARKGAHVIAIDTSDKLIEIAKEISKKESLNIDYRFEDCSQMKSIFSDSIDRIVCNYVLMNIDELENTIKEFYRVLKPTGEAVLIFSHPCFPMESIYENYENKVLVSFGWKSPYFQNHIMKLPKWDGFSDGFTILHRSLSEYWKIFKNIGFEIIDFDEPYLSEENKKQINPEIWVKKFSFIPHSVAFLLRKNK